MFMLSFPLLAASAQTFHIGFTACGSGTARFVVVVVVLAVMCSKICMLPCGTCNCGVHQYVQVFDLCSSCVYGTTARFHKSRG
jgi:hypothetical protein